MNSVYKSILLSLTCMIALGACSKKTNPEPIPGASTSQSPAAATAPQAVPAAPPPSTQNYSGEWSGNSRKDLPLTISVEGDTVKQVFANYSGQNGSCSYNGAFSADSPSPISNKTFSVTGKRDSIQFVISGTFTSATEVSGTIVWSGKTDMCGPIDLKDTWTAKKDAANTQDTANTVDE